MVTFTDPGGGERFLWLVEGMVGTGRGTAEATHVHCFLWQSKFLAPGWGIIGVSQVILKKEGNMPEIRYEWALRRKQPGIINPELQRRLGAAGRQN